MRILTRLFLITDFVILTSCASLGPSFVEKSVPSGKSVVYLYRPGKMAGSFGSPYVYIDGKKSFQIHNQSYAPITIDPGSHIIKIYGIIWSDVNKEIKFVTKANQDYFLRFELFKSDRDRSAAIGNLGVAGAFTGKKEGEDSKSTWKNAVDLNASAQKGSPALFFIKKELALREIPKTKEIK